MLFSLLFTLFSCSKSSVVSSTQTESQQSVTELSIAMLHIAPKLIKTESDLTHNAKLIEQGMRQAKAQGAQWVLTPELALTGYKFKHTLGTHWIKAGTDRWTQYLQGIAKELNLVLFLSHLDYLLLIAQGKLFIAIKKSIPFRVQSHGQPKVRKHR